MLSPLFIVNYHISSICGSMAHFISDEIEAGQGRIDRTNDERVKSMTAPPTNKKIHVVINPAAGKDEPILNVLNDVFREYGIDWDVSVTKKYGDAAQQAREAVARGASIVAGYGGRRGQPEKANAPVRRGGSRGGLSPGEAPPRLAADRRVVARKPRGERPEDHQEPGAAPPGPGDRAAPAAEAAPGER